MGFLNSLRDIGAVGLAPFTGGSSLFAASENTRSRIPLVGGLTGAQSDAEKQLLKKQEEMAKEAAKQRRRNEQARLNSLGQSMLAFNPRNQVMAQMFGPDAAFTPQQFAQMAADPNAPERAANWGKGTDEERQYQVQARDAERKRQAMIMNGMQQPGPGADPLQQRTPQAARRRV